MRLSRVPRVDKDKLGDKLKKGYNFGRLIALLIGLLVESRIFKTRVEGGSKKIL
jgi:hypothetical protein